MGVGAVGKLPLWKVRKHLRDREAVGRLLARDECFPPGPWTVTELKAGHVLEERSGWTHTVDALVRARRTKPKTDRWDSNVARHRQEDRRFALVVATLDDLEKLDTQMTQMRHRLRGVAWVLVFPCTCEDPELFRFGGVRVVELGEKA